MAFQLARWLWQQYPGDQTSLPLNAFIPSTAYHNTDLAELQIGSLETVLLAESLEAPDQIYLTAKLEGVRQTQDTLTVRLQDDTHLFDPILLYPETTQEYAWSYVTLESAGYGNYLWNHQWIPFCNHRVPQGVLKVPSPLYHHSFIRQTESFIFAEDEHVQVMKGYGGFYRPSCRVEEIQQIFFTVRSEGPQAAFYLSSLSDWQEKGLMPPQEGDGTHKRIRFVECGDQLLTSFYDAIQQGQVVIQLILGGDEAGEEVIQPYCSFQVKNSGRDQVTIGFTKREVK
jgi:hypothetical protein